MCQIIHPKNVKNRKTKNGKNTKIRSHEKLKTHFWNHFLNNDHFENLSHFRLYSNTYRFIKQFFFCFLFFSLYFFLFVFCFNLHSLPMPKKNMTTLLKAFGDGDIYFLNLFFSFLKSHYLSIPNWRNSFFRSVLIEWKMLLREIKGKKNNPVRHKVLESLTRTHSYLCCIFKWEKYSQTLTYTLTKI